eukprot:scaffold12591_cov102-Isochrysis_galbana.AAC.7
MWGRPVCAWWGSGWSNLGPHGQGRGQGGRPAGGGRGAGAAGRARTSFLSMPLPRLKQAKRILRWPGLSPSTHDGMERRLSALEKWISSLSTKSE